MTHAQTANASYQGTAFNCPHCHAYSNQTWSEILDRAPAGSMRTLTEFQASRCAHCLKWCIWLQEALVFPSIVSAPTPNEDLPNEIQNDFNEARGIASLSPRGAAALLRLCIQKICTHLGEPGKHINADIKALVAKGLPIQVQQSLDIVRVVGNNSVHPGQLNLQDDTATVDQLFDLVNLIAEIMISQPKHVAQLYNKTVPESQREAITKRDRT